MKNRKNKLVVKIFIAVVFIFTVVMLAQMAIEKYLINDIYLNEKTRRMADAFDNLLTYEDLSSIEEFVVDFNETNEAPVIVFDKGLNIHNETYFDQFTSIIVTSGEQDYRVTMEAYVDEQNDFVHELKTLSEGDDFEAILVKVKGTSLYVPLTIGNRSSSYLAQAMMEVTDEEVDFSGKVKTILKAERKTGVIGYQPDILLNELLNLWLDKSQLNYLESNRMLTFDFIEERSGLHRFIYLGRLDDHEDIYLLSMITIENVQDVFKVLSNYYGLIFGILIGLTLVLSLLFTRWITKPILKLNRLALDIADKNFESPIKVTSGDELETLSESLHVISNNMDQAFKDIEASNQELAVEVIKRQENEERMRNMLAGLSHEFKTPLGIASGFIEIIKDGVGDKEPEYYLDSVEDELDRMNAMVKETLDLTRLETGSYQLKPTSFSINDLIVQVYNRLNSHFESKSQNILFELVDIKVCADQNKIEQVLVNLLSNANKYAYKGSTIEVELLVEDKVWVKIRNDFDGFDDGELTHLWDRFYRTEKSRNKTTGGTGLGLTIVKNILELHGESYGVRHTDTGAEFYFSLTSIEENGLF